MVIGDIAIFVNNPKERLSEFFCNLMEDDREIIDKIYNKLPIEVINENANRNLIEELIAV